MTRGFVRPFDDPTFTYTAIKSALNKSTQGSSRMIRRWFKNSLFALAVVAVSVHAQTKVLLNNFTPATYYLTPILHAWAADVEKATEGRVKIEFAAGSLAPPNQQLSGVESSIFDAAFTSNIFAKNKAPLIEFSALPWLTSDAEAASVALWRVYQKRLADKKQYPDVHLLSLFSIVGGQLYSADDRAIQSVDALKAHKVWGLPGPAADLLKVLGISPITSPAIQVSESISRGVVDAIYGMSYEAVTDFKAAPYVKTITRFPATATATNFALFINKTKWASIGEKDRAAIMAVSGEAFAARAGQGANKASADALATMKATGVKVVDVDPAFYAALQTAAEPGYKQYAEIAAKQGVDATALIDDFKAEYKVLVKP
ncbi:MAG: TRAP transporter substrate-binding protein DctP [Variovorax sp.]